MQCFICAGNHYAKNCPKKEGKQQITPPDDSKSKKEVLMVSFNAVNEVYDNKT